MCLLAFGWGLGQSRGRWSRCAEPDQPQLPLKKDANRKLDSTRTDSVRVESVLSMFWVYILLHWALGAMILEAYPGTFYAGRRLWARLCTGHTGPSIASWPGFALAARGQTNPGSHWLAFSVLSKSHSINESISTLTCWFDRPPHPPSFGNALVATCRDHLHRGWC